MKHKREEKIFFNTVNRLKKEGKEKNGLYI